MFSRSSELGVVWREDTSGVCLICDQVWCVCPDNAEWEAELRSVNSHTDAASYAASEGDEYPGQSEELDEIEYE